MLNHQDQGEPQDFFSHKSILLAMQKRKEAANIRSTSMVISVRMFNWLAYLIPPDETIRQSSLYLQLLPFFILLVCDLNRDISDVIDECRLESARDAMINAAHTPNEVSEARELLEPLHLDFRMARESMWCFLSTGFFAEATARIFDNSTEQEAQKLWLTELAGLYLIYRGIVHALESCILEQCYKTHYSRLFSYEANDQELDPPPSPVLDPEEQEPLLAGQLIDEVAEPEAEAVFSCTLL